MPVYGSLQASLADLEQLKYMPDDILKLRLKPWDQRSLLGLDWRAELSRFTSLQTLDLSECLSLKQPPEQIWQLTSLQSLVLGCAAQATPHYINRAKLGQQQCLGSAADPSQRCSEFCELPEALGNLTKLTRLDLSFCKDFKQLPASLCSLAGLEDLRVSHCELLVQLPPALGSLAALKHLDIDHCEAFRQLPESFSKLTRLQYLDASWCRGLASLPEGFGRLAALQQLKLRGCKALKALPEGFAQLQQLQELDLGRCSSLLSLPAQFGALGSLQQLRLDYSAIATLPASFGKLGALTSLDIRWCKNLNRLPDSCAKLEQLVVFRVVDCPAVPEVPPQRLDCCKPGSGYQQLRWVLKQQQQRVAVQKLANQQEPMLSTLERMSWLVVLLATATFVAYLSPPGGLGDDKQVLVSSVASCSAAPAVEGMTGFMQCAMLMFFVLDGLSFGLSFGCLIMIVMLSMPRIQWADEQAEAGRFYILLLCTWLLLFLAVVTGFAAFIASGLAVHKQAGAVLGPVVPGMVLLLAGTVFFWHRFDSIYPGWDAIWAARPFQYRDLAPVETDVELGQAAFWREWPKYLAGLQQLQSAGAKQCGQPILAAPTEADAESVPLLGKDGAGKRQPQPQQQAAVQVLCVAGEAR